MKVPYIDLVAQHAPIKEELMAAVSQVFDHGHFILGDDVDEFERRFAELCGARYAVGVNSGTDALILTLRALGIGPGDEVITAPNSFVSSAGCIAMLEARPVFVDVSDDYNLDPSLIEAAITPRTKAILPIHLTGRPAPMGPINAIAKAHGLFVVEDAAQAVAAEFDGQRVGSLGTVGCFSLHPLKTLNACGDGGVITTNDEALYQEFRVLRNIGLQTRDSCVAWAGNSRLDSLQAAILLVKLKYLEMWTEKRRANASLYQQLFADLETVEVPVENSNERSVYHTFVIQADQRDQLKKYLAEKNVGTAIHYPIPIHLQEAAKDLGYGKGSFPLAERQAQHILSLPVYPDLQVSQMEYVSQVVHDFYAGGGD